MSLKDAVLRQLRSDETVHSGTALARELGVSRGAVWKAVEQLRAEGYGIEAATNRGYRLVSAPEALTLPEIDRWRKPGPIGAQLEIHEQLASTNDRARELALAGAPHGTTVLARSQTGGRGRFGRPFFSPQGSGVYLSFVLRPQLPAERAVMLTSLCAVAVARAAEKVADGEIRAQIKWVNDVYIGPRKFCGILCEAGLDFESGQMHYVVAGIGVNVDRMDFPEELQGIATSISNACGRPLRRARFCGELLNEMNALYPQLESGAFMEENRARSNVIGREIRVLRGDESYPATAVDIDDRGGLVLRTADGQLHTLRSGEISIRFADS